MRNVFFVSLAVMALGVLSSCTPIGLAAGAGATAGIAASQEGGISGAASDFRITTEINDLWFRSNVDIFRKLNLTVDQGRVLITGVVQDPAHRVEAVRLAWQPKGVKQVINEIQVADSDGISGYVRDTWISTQLRTKMTLDAAIQSINYSIETVQGVVYLMGVARSQEELDHVMDVARQIKNVKQVISYVKMLGEPVMSTATGAVGQGANTPAMAPSPMASKSTAQPIVDRPAVDGVAPAPDAVEKTMLPP